MTSSTRARWQEFLVVSCIGVAPDVVHSQLALLLSSPPVDTFLQSLCYVMLRAVWVSVPVLWIMRQSGEPLAAFGLGRPRDFDVLLGCLTFALCLAVHYGAWSVVQHVPADPPRHPMLFPSTPFELALLPLMGLANGFAEELVVRAYLITRLCQLVGVLPALLGSTALFAAYHTYQGLHSVLLLVAGGLVLGLVFLATRRLWPVALAHAALDVYWCLA